MNLAILLSAIASLSSLQQQCKAHKGAACDELGDRYRLGLSTTKNELRASDAYKASCAAGFADGCADDLFAAAIGFGRPKDPAAPAQLEEKCKGGNARACGRFGHLLHEGVSVPVDRARGEELMSSACKVGHLESCTNMSIASFQTGDETRAEQFGRAACDNGDAEGCAIEADRELLKHDQLRATVDFAQACQLGSVKGCRGQALLILEAGADRKKALALLDDGCKLGDKPSCQAAQAAREK